MTTMDVIVLVLLGGGIVLGVMSGFVTEVLSLFAWAAALFALKLLHAPISHFLIEIVGSSGGAAVVAFVLIFLATFLLGKFVANSLGRRTRQSILGPLDRVLGGGFGALKGLLVATVAFLAVNLLLDVWSGKDAARPDWMRNSKTYPLLNASGRAIVDFVRIRRGAHPLGINPHDVGVPNAQSNGAV
jgi:membrane protein required for colicin V production